MDLCSVFDDLNHFRPEPLPYQGDCFFSSLMIKIIIVGLKHRIFKTSWLNVLLTY